MAGPHVCAKSGYLWGPEENIPTDPVEFRLGTEPVIVACSQLVCLACKEKVRSEIVVSETKQSRRYWCACRQYFQREGLRNAEEDDELDPALDWRCAGHPVATLPLEIDGVRVANEADARALMKQTLSGWMPDAARPAEREVPEAWAAKLYVRLLHTALEDVTSLAAAQCLTDADARVRAVATRFFCDFPDAAGAEFADMKEDLFDRFVGVALNRIEARS